MSNLFFAALSMTVALTFGQDLTTNTQDQSATETQIAEQALSTPLGTAFGSFVECDEITVINYTGSVQYFQIAVDCNGDGEADGVVDEAFIPFNPDKREPSVTTIRRKWWYPCRISHLIYMEPSGGGPQATVTQVGPCTIIIT